MGSSGGKDIEGVGIPGPKGERGENGNSIHSGEGVPSNELGVNNDFYIDKLSHKIYGPKSGGVWGSATGLVGARGEIGLTGVEGPKGATGATGATGSTGPQGVEGPKGSSGEKGATGIQGEKGATGPAGEKGERGEKGEKGSTGTEGSKGATGATGLTGPEGPRGEIGPKGSTGSSGATGAEGAKGEKGETGAKGETGSIGPAASLGEWKALSLEAGITNKGAPYSNAEVAKDSMGLVYLRGVVKSSGLLSKEAVLATIPEGYRPNKQQSVTANLGATIGNLFILTNGKIEISLGVSLETPFYFDGIFFPLV
jgi:Collagen triple helix repeat (20 copies)